MKLKFILLILTILMLSQSCERPSNRRRKIKLAMDKTSIVSKITDEKTTVLKFNGEEKRSIAILMFVNRTGDRNLQWLCQGITDMLIRDLSQSRFLNVITIQRVLDIFSNLGIQSPEKVDYKMISTIGKKAQAEAVITGGFSVTEDSVSINVQLYNANSGRLLQEEKVTGQGLEQIFGMVDELSRKVKSNLKLSFNETAELDLSIADISTKSLEAYKYYTEGVDLAYKAYFGDAITKFEKAIEVDSTFAMAHFWAGITYSCCLGKTNEAICSIDKAVKFSEHASPKEKMKINWVHAAFNEEHEKAFDLLKELVQAYPDDKELQYQLAGNYYVHKEIDKTEEHLKYAFQLDPEYVPLYTLQSRLFRDKGDYESAINTLKKYIKIKPDDALPYHNLGEIYESIGDYQKGIEYFKKALSIKPDFHFSMMDLAHIHSTLGNYQTAREQYLSALNILPSEELKAEVYSGLAHVDLSTGKYRQAIGNIKQALNYPSSDIGRAHYLAMLARIYFRKQIFDSTIVFASKALALQKNNLSALSAHYIKGKAFLEKGKIDSAKNLAQSMDQLIKDSKFEIFRNIHLRLLGKIAAAEGRYDDAIKYFEQILVDNPEATSIYQDLGMAYVDKNEPSKAIESYNKYITKNPKDALIQYYLALAYAADGNTKKAKKLMRKFLEMWREADQDIPELVQAKQLLTEWEQSS